MTQATETHQKQIRLWVSEDLYLRLSEARLKEKKINVNLRDYAFELLQRGLEEVEKNLTTK